jgi:hypothetical protein
MLFSFRSVAVNCKRSVARMLRNNNCALTKFEVEDRLWGLDVSKIKFLGVDNFIGIAIITVRCDLLLKELSLSYSQ